MLKRYKTFFDKVSPKLLLIWGGLVVMFTVLGWVIMAEQQIERFLSEKRLIKVLLDYPVHLGDNVHSPVGGDRSRRPIPSGCLEAASEAATVFCYDKERSQGYSVGAITRYAQRHYYAHIEPVLKFVNLGAWRHTALENPKNLTPVERAGAVMLGPSALVWREDKGNFYDSHAPFLLSVQTSFLELLHNNEVDLNRFSKASVDVVFHILTGGKRPDQDEQIFVFLDDTIQSVELPTQRTRDVRKYTAHFDVDLGEIALGKISHVGIFVLPWQEAGPRPPEFLDYDQRGPGHFRDIDVNMVAAEIHLY